MQINHAVYDEKKILQFMHDDTIFTATLRYPFDTFRSKYHFFQNRYHRYYKTDVQGDAIAKILEEAVYDKDLQLYTFPGRQRELQSSMYKYFQQDHDRAVRDTHYFEESLKTLEKRFPVVLINEYFDQSLVLFRRHMCWQMKDILYVAHKNASYDYKNKTQEDYGELFQRHQNISMIDYKLYNHFIDIYKREFNAGGQSIINEVETFQKLNLKTNLFCKNVYESLISAHYNTAEELKVLRREEYFGKTEFNSEFTLSAGDCLLMVIYIHELETAIAAMNYESCCEMSCTAVKINSAHCQNKCNNCIQNSIPLSVLHHDVFKDMQ